MTVRSRQEKIRKLVPSINPLMTIEGRMIGSYVVSPSGIKYHQSLPSKPVIVDNAGERYYEYGCTCYNVSDPSGMPACPGNSNGHVCYHSVAALITRAERLGYEIIIVNHYQSAVKIADQVDGCIIRLKSNQGDGVAWLVGKKIMKNEPALVSAVEGIEMMRGDKDEVIE